MDKGRLLLQISLAKTSMNLPIVELCPAVATIGIRLIRPANVRLQFSRTNKCNKWQDACHNDGVAGGSYEEFVKRLCYRKLTSRSSWRNEGFVFGSKKKAIHTEGIFNRREGYTFTMGAKEPNLPPRFGVERKDCRAGSIF